jgi:Glycosyltransferases involved in cell wall biogenesis
MTRTEIINFLIDDNNYESYLEIGTSNPEHHFDLVNIKTKESVDPCVECEYYSSEDMEKFKNEVTYCMTSDEFFKQNEKEYDLIFIDGDHSCEQSAKDIINALNSIKNNGCVVCHDSMPEQFELTQISNYEQGKPYHGEVWKPIHILINSGLYRELEIRTIYHDLWSSCTVIKKTTNVQCDINCLLARINNTNLDYDKDFRLNKMNAVYSLQDLACQKVSYFTSLYQTDPEYLQELYYSLMKQTNPNWEWVIVDDSPTSELYETLLANEDYDKRVKYQRFQFQSNGAIGEAKYRAAMLCTGTLLAELDHDDILMPEMTQELLNNVDYDFIATNSTYVKIDNVNEKYVIEKLPKYDDGFAMGYGSYRNTEIEFPLDGQKIELDECIVPPINPKTLRHIVGIPNHIRCWRKDFYMKIGGHNRTMSHCDDYELVVRTFLNGCKFKHIDRLLYIQRWHPENTTDKRRDNIQVFCKSIVASLDNQIADYFYIENGEETDWAYEYLQKYFGGHITKNFFENNYNYNYFWVPNEKEARYDILHGLGEYNKLQKNLEIQDQITTLEDPETRDQIINLLKNNNVQVDENVQNYIISLGLEGAINFIKNVRTSISENQDNIE